MFSNDQECSDKRKFLRAGFRGTVSFVFPEADESNGCVSRDISEKGLRVNFEHFVKPSTPVKVRFRLAPHMEFLAFDGRIAWASQIASSERYHLGVEFTSHDEEGEKDIHKYVLAHSTKEFSEK